MKYLYSANYNYVAKVSQFTMSYKILIKYFCIYFKLVVDLETIFRPGLLKNDIMKYLFPKYSPVDIFKQKYSL